jgi:hypothetical protein
MTSQVSVCESRKATWKRRRRQPDGGCSLLWLT